MARLKKITHKNADGTTKTYDVSYDRFSQNVDGLVPRPSASNHYSSYYLGGDGNWHYLSIPTIPSVFSQNTDGLVPGPNNNEASFDYYLAGNGEWYPMPEIFAKNDNGLVPQPGNDLIGDYADYYLGADVELHSTKTIYEAGIGLSLNDTTFTVTGVKPTNGTTPITFNPNSSIPPAAFSYVPVFAENGTSIIGYTDKDYFLNWIGEFRDEDNENLDRGGLVPYNPAQSSNEYLGGDGNWHSLPGVFTSSSSGLVPRFDKSLSSYETGQEYYLGGNGKWYGAFNSSHNGLVPAPKQYSSSDYYLSGDGNWQELPSAPPLFSKSFNGIVRAPGDSNTSDYYLGGDNYWHYLSSGVTIDTTSSITTPFGVGKGIWLTTSSSSIQNAGYIDNDGLQKTGTVSIPAYSLYMSCGHVGSGNDYEGFYLTSKGIYHGSAMSGYASDLTWSLIAPCPDDVVKMILNLIQ